MSLLNSFKSSFLPQISPLQWDLLFLFCLVVLSFIVVKLYFLEILVIKFNKRKSILFNSLNWAW